MGYGESWISWGLVFHGEDYPLTLVPRRIGISREQARREGEADEPANGFRSTQNNDDEDMDI